MSIPKPPSRKPHASEIAATWKLLFDSVREELIAAGAEQVRATEIAAYVAATLAKESRHGNQPRDH